MNVLYGLYHPDEGEFLVDDVPVRFQGPGDAIRAGIGWSTSTSCWGPSSPWPRTSPSAWSHARPLRVPRPPRRAAADRGGLGGHGLHVDPDAVVEDLPVGIRQRVEIIKALYRRSDVLILDEPTAVLTPQEDQELFEVMRSLAVAGTSIIFITHKLNEVLEIADRITVLRRGKVAGITTPAETNEGELARMMVGRPVQLQVTKPEAHPGDPVLEVRNLSVRDDRGHLAVAGVDLTVRAGEIVAVAGVQGNGQTELVEAITGMRASVGGEIDICGSRVRPSPRHVFEAGVGHIPEDRLEEGWSRLHGCRELILNSYHLKPYSDGLQMNRDAIWPRQACW